MTTDTFETNYREKFDPKAYLADYFSEMDEIHTNLLRFVARIAIQYPEYLQQRKILSFSCGPSIDDMVSFAPHCAQIDMADYLEANLAEIQQWLSAEATAFNWQPTIKHILELEAEIQGKPTHISEEEINARTNLVRNKIKHLLSCDIRQPHPLGATAAGSYDVLSMSFCVEVVATNLEEWQQFLKNVLSLLKPNGFLIWIMTESKTTGYKVGTQTFHITPITETDVRKEIMQYILADTLTIDFIDFGDIHELTKGAYLVTAIKK